jgi:hypothetical protein
MHPSAQAVWHDFTIGFEGEVAFMYLDTIGLVTVGIGNLVDPVSAAVSLPFQFKAKNNAGKPAGQPATQAEIAAEWMHLKHHPKAEHLKNAGHRACAAETNLELDPRNLLALFNRKTASNEAYLTKTFHDFSLWPADAQLSLMSMSWAMGPAFHKNWPGFRMACLKKDFDTASANCNMKPGRKGDLAVLRRNAADKTMFANAARVLRNPDFYSPFRLYWPTFLLDAVLITSGPTGP